MRRDQSATPVGVWLGRSVVGSRGELVKSGVFLYTSVELQHFYFFSFLHLLFHFYTITFLLQNF